MVLIQLLPFFKPLKWCWCYKCEHFINISTNVGTGINTDIRLDNVKCSIEAIDGNNKVLKKGKLTS